MAHAFGPEKRLRKQGDFSHVQRSGRRVTTPHFVLLLASQLPASSSELPRMGLVVTRKLGPAVQRNRVKRLCRECFRSWPGFVPSGVDLVVIARAGAQGLRLDDVRAEWRGVVRLVQRRAAEALARRAGTDHPPAEGPVSPPAVAPRSRSSSPPDPPSRPR